MKTNIKILVLILLGTFFTQCTSDFDKINVNPNGFTQEEVSAKFFLTPVQVGLYGPSRFAYWRANLIHADRYAGHVAFGFSGCWWNDGLGYSYNSGYTDAAWDQLSGYIGSLENFQKLVRTGGDFENQYMDAMATIMRGIYFQLFTDTFGMISYSEATDPEIVLPKLDDQAIIYRGIIDELDQAMATIGDAERTGASVDDAGENDLYYGGDLQKWKKLANTLKLRIAMRALGAPGADFAQGAISSALAAPLLETEDENAILPKDITISQWSSACYGDVYYNFGRGSDWKVGKTLIDYLRDFDDPRLPIFADPAPGGTVVLAQPEGEEAETHQKRVDFIKATLTDAGVDFTENVTDEGTEISFAPDTYYIGQPSRLNGDTRAYSKFEFWSKPDDYIVGRKNADPLSPELILTTAEAYFLRAEAAVRGLGSDNAQEMYQEGIRQSMQLWTVSDSDIDAFMANSSMAQLDGTMDEMLEKIAIQRWINAYTDGFEAWAIVRDTGYPSELAAGVDDYDIFAAGDINGNYPQRMRYGNRLINTNGANAATAIATQGPDQQDTKLWWAK